MTGLSRHCLQKNLESSSHQPARPLPSPGLLAALCVTYLLPAEVPGWRQAGWRGIWEGSRQISSQIELGRQEIC